MKFPPILHRPALFCLFGLIVIAVIGGAISWVGFKEWLRSWQELVGAIIGGSIAGAAIWVTTRETRNALYKQLQDRKDARKEEVARTLAILHAVIALENEQLSRVVLLINLAKARPDELSQRTALSLLVGAYKYEHQTIILNCCAELGDSSPSISTNILLFHQYAKILCEYIDKLAAELRKPFNELPLVDGGAIARANPILGMIGSTKVQSELSRIVIERWLAANNLGHLLTQAETNFTPAEQERINALRPLVEI